MKKRFLVLAGIVGLTVSLLAACGNGTSNMDTQKEDSFQQNEIAQNKTETQEEIIEESEQTSETESEALLPEDRAWIDEVYNDLLAGNKEDIIALLTSKDLVEKVAPYIKESWAMWDYEEAQPFLQDSAASGSVLLRRHPLRSHHFRRCLHAGRYPDVLHLACDPVRYLRRR